MSSQSVKREGLAWHDEEKVWEARSNRRRAEGAGSMKEKAGIQKQEMGWQEEAGRQVQVHKGRCVVRAARVGKDGRRMCVCGKNT